MPNVTQVCFFFLSLPPPAIENELRALCRNDEDDEGVELLRLLFTWLLQQLRCGEDFELMQAYLYRAVLIYSEVLRRRQAQFSEILTAVKESHQEKVGKFRGLLQSNLCLLKLFARISVV